MKEHATLKLRNSFLLLFLLTLTSVGTAQITVLPNGDVGINNTAPINNLHLQQSGAVAALSVERVDKNNYINMQSGSTGNSLYFSDEKRFSIVPSANISSTSPNNSNSIFMYGPDWMPAAQAGNVGIGRVSPIEKLDVNGNVRATGYITASDRRLKQNIQDYKGGLNQLLKLHPVTFEYNQLSGIENDGLQIGLLAQEVRDVLPHCVAEFQEYHYVFDEDGSQRSTGYETYLQIYDSRLKFVIINALKEFYAEFTVSERKNEELREIVRRQKLELTDLSKRLAQLEAKLD